MDITNNNQIRNEITLVDSASTRNIYQINPEIEFLVGIIYGCIKYGYIKYGYKIWVYEIWVYKIWV